MAVLSGVCAVLILVVLCCCLWKRFKPSSHCGAMESHGNRRRKASGKPRRPDKSSQDTNQTKKPNTLPVKALSGKNYQPNPSPFKKCQDWVEQVHRENAELYQYPVMELEVSGYEEFIMGIRAREAFRPVLQEENPASKSTKQNSSNGCLNYSKPTHVSRSALGSMNSVNNSSCNVGKANSERPAVSNKKELSCSQNSDLGYGSTPGPKRGRVRPKSAATVERSISNKSGSGENQEQLVHHEQRQDHLSSSVDPSPPQKQDLPAGGMEDRPVQDSNTGSREVNNTSQHTLRSETLDDRPRRSPLNEFSRDRASPAQVHQDHYVGRERWTASREALTLVSYQVAPPISQTVLHTSQTHISKETQV